MHLFIDESGDTGCKGSSTQYFVIAVVIFENIEDLQETQILIEDFKLNENLKTELHFCKSSNDLRDKFFYCVRNARFYAKAICVNKNALYSEYLINNPNKLYNYVLKLLLDSLEIKEELKIIIDGKSGKQIQKELKKYIKINTKMKIKEIKMVDSKKDILIQLADMIASCIGHAYNKKDKPNADKWQKIISHKLKIWNFR